MKKFALAFLTAGFLLATDTAYAADVSGSKDPEFLKRFADSAIVYYNSRSFDQYHLGIDTATDKKFKKTIELEGQITRIVYHEPAGHTALELLRNYQQALGEAGFKQLWEAQPVSGNDLGLAAYRQAWQAGDDPFPWGPTQQNGYVSAQAEKNGQIVSVAVTVADYTQPFDFKFPGTAKPAHFDNGQLLVLVDVITAKPVKNSMVTVKAADMADALATKGTVDLYGIYFDVDKTAIKPESTATLDEVASLLKIDRSLKLEISGHTDNTGDKAHNQALSEGRATAVVQALVTKYGIDASRLQGKGYGDTKPVAPNDTDEGKAKNRRVELRKL